MSFWLMKSEPDAYSIDDLKRDRRTGWDGVRNYQVRNLFRDEMRQGDLAFFYHSSCPDPGIAGIMAVDSAAVADPSQFDPRSDYYDPASRRDDPRWLMVYVRFRRKLPRVVTLDELRAARGLAALPVLRRGNRLSVTPVSAAQWQRILGLL